METDGDRDSYGGLGGLSDLCRDFGTYGDSGDLEYRRGHKYDSEYGNHVAIYQLRRDFGTVFAGGDGAGSLSEPVQKAYLNLGGINSAQYMESLHRIVSEKVSGSAKSGRDSYYRRQASRR